MEQGEAQVVVKEEEEGEKVKLGLGIGVDCNYDDHNGFVGKENKKQKKKHKKENCGGGGGLLTGSQLHDLEQQALIYKHLAAGLPVPFHLLLPIWNSVAASFGSSNAAAIYKHYPSFVRFSPLGLDYRNNMDPQPGRCRRTDGKKWRCSKNVTPAQKYCEQQMHRGRQRSRKPVEISEAASPSRTKTPQSSEGGASTPKGLQVIIPSSNNTSVSHGITTASTGYHECNQNIRSVTTTSVANVPAYRNTTTPAAVATATTVRPTTAANGIRNENNLNIGVKDNSSNHAGDNCMIRGSSRNRNINVGTNISSGLGFSPKSVLQGRSMTLLGRNGLYFDNRNGVELEPGRCRRTDGKKWRCRRDVLPGQKYCGRHMHRGAKRQMKDFQPVAVPSASAAALNTSRLSQATPIPGNTDCEIPSTNLSMSIPARPSLIQSVVKSNSSSESDTTISDTSLTAYDRGYVSS